MAMCFVSLTFFFVLFLFSFFLNNVCGHSWLACADYQAELDPNNQDFDHGNCQGYARDHKSNTDPSDFGDKEVGRFTSSTNAEDISCQKSLQDPITNGYDDDYNYAVYVPGGTYRLVWPAKNHAIGECDPISTDNNIRVYVNPHVNPTSDLTSVNDYTLVYDWHAESGEDFSNGKGKEGIPFANCMDYCSDTDVSPCFGDIVIPTDIFSTNGFYTFLWYWEFTTSQYYVTCYDAYVNVDGTIATPNPSIATTITTNSNSPTAVTTVTGTTNPTTGVKITRLNDPNFRWMKLSIDDVATGWTLTEVKIRGFGDNSAWANCRIPNKFWYCNAPQEERRWTLPYDIQITATDSEGGSKTIPNQQDNNVITSIEKDDVFYLGVNFDTA